MTTHRDRHRDRPLPFTAWLPEDRQHLAWLPRQTVTLAFWPCGQGHTVFEAKYAPQTREIGFNVALITSAQGTTP
jgi:hypothetical protein